MSHKKRLKYRQLRKILKKFGIKEDARRGKGLERLFVGIVDGEKRQIPTKCHSENDEKPIPVIESIRRRFNLTEEHGISDKDFYGRS